MKPWMVIAGVTFFVALGSFFIRPRRDLRWVQRLNLPAWVASIEPAIPLIWVVAFTGGAWSALLVWQQDPGTLRTGLLMGLYLLIEIVTVAYVPFTLRLRSLAVGKFLGGLGAVLGILLFVLVSFISGKAALLLLPYVLWSPVGTYATGELIELNPDSL